MSGEMNEWLADMYGTNQSNEDYLEKTAQSYLLAKLAEEQNLDLNQFTPEQIEQLTQMVLAEEQQVQAQPQAQQPVAQPQGAFAPAGGYQQAAQPQVQDQGWNTQAPQGFNPGLMAPQAQTPEMMAKEAQAKFEEADLLGRVMAHAYTQELEKIASAKEKTAGRFGAAVGHAKTVARGVHARAGGLARKAYEHKGHVGAAAGGAAAGFVAGRKSKHASAFEKLAEMRAAEILQAIGIDPATGQQIQQQPEQPPQQAAGDQTQDFQGQLDGRALEILSQHGYNTDAIVNTLSAGDAGGGNPAAGVAG